MHKAPNAASIEFSGWTTAGWSKADLAVASAKLPESTLLGHSALAEGTALLAPFSDLRNGTWTGVVCESSAISLARLMLGASCTKIYREKVTGAHNDRRELLKMLDHLAPGDVVTVTRIDRLARSTFDLFAIVKQIVDAEAQFRSLAEPWADTGTSTGRLMIAVLGGLADVERDLIRTRTAEGRSRAQKRGQRMGRKPKLTVEQQAEAPQAPGGRCYPRRTRAQLRRRQEHDFPTVTKRPRPGLSMAKAL
jgi:hypothetical protein